jgi:Brp/Blh family beta-carotene 15,15'-monooxygenase
VALLPAAQRPAGADRVVAVPARAATVASLAAVAATVAVELTLGWGELAWVPLVVGLLAALPHGAVDHLLPGRRLGWQAPRLAAFTGVYAAVAAAAWLLFSASPGPALLGFVLLSAWHFGSGETAFADLRAGRPVRRAGTAAGVLGSLVLLVPLARGAGDAAPVVADVVPGSTGVVPAGLTTAVLAVVLPSAAALVLERARERRWLEAAETGALLVLVLVVPPFAAFGVYLGCWHSVRHVARLVAGDPASAADLAAGRTGAPLRRFAVAAALPTAAVLGVLALLWSAADGWRGLLATTLPLVAALTLPHALVVAWLDRADGPPAGMRRRGV